MAVGDKPKQLIIAGVIELVFSIIIIFYAIIAGLFGSAGKLLSFGFMTMGGDEYTTTVSFFIGFFVTILSIMLALAALVLGIIGIIGAVNLLKGKRAGAGISIFWAIALFIVFILGVIGAIIQMASLSAVNATLADTTADANKLNFDQLGGGVGIVSIMLGCFFYLFPAVSVFILLKLKTVKEYFTSRTDK